MEYRKCQFLLGKVLREFDEDETCLIPIVCQFLLGKVLPAQPVSEEFPEFVSIPLR